LGSSLLGAGEGDSAGSMGVVGVGVAGGLEASSIRRAIACVWIVRSRSAAIASATAARRSASASAVRRASSWAVRASAGAVVVGVRGLSCWLS
jgi:hypothetical protein